MDDLRSRFGFHQTPFTRELLVEQRLNLPIFDEPLTALKRAVDARASAALIAPSGTGKSTLLRTLSAQLPEARYRVHYVKVTDLCKRDMCYEIATVIGAKPAGNYPALVRAIQDRSPRSPTRTPCALCCCSMRPTTCAKTCSACCAS